MQADAAELPLTRKLRYWAETAVFFLVIGFFRLFSIDRASAIGGWIARNLAGRTFLSGRPLRNLRTAFPEKNECEIAGILNAMWDNLGRVMAEYAHLDEISWGGSSPRITIAGLQHFEAAKARGKGIILASAHFANWEIMPAVAEDLGLKGGGEVYRPQNNPFVDRWLVKKRMVAGPKGTGRYT